MRHFGFDRFAVIGQDRGGRVTHRMLLDHPALVTKAAVLDILPTYYLYTHVTMAFIQTYYHWFSYVRAAPAPENDLIAGYDNAALKPPASDVQAEYRRVQNNPAGAHGMCEDYRAAASIDLVHDAADIDTTIGVPLLVLWADLVPWRGCTTCWPCGGSAARTSPAAACPAATTCKKALPRRSPANCWSSCGRSSMRPCEGRTASGTELSQHA
jgi:pimeloyl-ACP methyl ester carboxylesterase